MIKLSYVYDDTGYHLQGEPVNLGLGGAGQSRTVTWEYTISDTAQDKNYFFDCWYKATGDVKGFCGTANNCWTETEPPQAMEEMCNEVHEENKMQIALNIIREGVL